MDYFMQNKILRHILFWLSYVLVMTYIHGLGVSGGRYLPWFLNYLVELPVLMGLSYLISYFIIPVFFRNGKFGLGSLLIIMALLSFSFMNILLDKYIIGSFFAEKQRKEMLIDLSVVFRNAFGLVFPVVIFVVISFTRYNVIKTMEESRSERNRLNSELDRIRYRMHPVFLRDALDDIYVVSRHPSAELPEMILKISDILHYFLYECEVERLALRKEEQVIRNYLSFIKLRYGENFNYDIYVEGSLENTLISPYILFPLVRSVIRFNRDYDTLPGKIFLEFKIEDKNMYFTISQKKNGNSYPENAYYDWKEEVKLARKRLDLIYAWDYSLDIREADQGLTIGLKLFT